jgi:hypothetical protein
LQNYQYYANVYAVNRDKILEELPEDLPFAPPDVDYLSEVYLIEIPLDDKHFGDRWKLRVYAEKVLEQRLGDTVQLTSLKVKKPHAVGRAKAKLLKRQLVARLYVTVKF